MKVVLFPIPKDSALKLDVEIAHKELGMYKIPIHLTLGKDSETFKLQRGVYFIALPSMRTDVRLNWRDYQFFARKPEEEDQTEVENIKKRLYRSDWNQDQPVLVDFEYIELRVNYADV